ncbi:type II secretion system protein GspL [Thalassotalea profundi]|uniref:Type II secretion system protein L n=1 Tax=Thalassotalea profundi TaxID=2036687 RepID=A0ABQ3J1U2_9GAMM|nr:type II secretion system protein GspL [Thalassotalea profundi]GHE99869.1 type II secretion system protein L [Thalassotalea profundi]
MAETLYIRLGSTSNERIHWLVYSDTEQEIIASGELSGALALEHLTEKSLQRKVVVFVPGCDIAIKQLHVPAKSQRAIKLAVPYMLEDELAQDVDHLFFAYANIKNDANTSNCFVAVVEQVQMERWLSWLNEAGIRCKTMLPDVLALPVVDNTWQAVALGEQILIKQSQWQAQVVDTAIWPLVSDNLANNFITAHKEDGLPILQHYSPLSGTSEQLTLESMPEELPLALLAKGSKGLNFNLLQGQFQVKEKRSPALRTWQIAAAIMGIAFIMNLTYKGVHLWQLADKQQLIEQEIINTYKNTFPKTKRVSVTTVKSQLKGKMSEIGAGDQSDSFLVMLANIEPAFAMVKDLKPSSIKFDSKRKELRLQASANGYQQFEQFKQQLEKQQFAVSLGAQNNQGDKVSGSFSIVANTQGGRL